MDVLEPELIWIEGRCYRVFDSSAQSMDNETSIYEEEPYSLDYDYANDESCVDFEIVTIDEGKYKHSFRIAKVFFAHIIGAKGSTRKRLELETKTSIRIPKLGQDGDIVIIGSNRRGIISARHRIDLLVASSRKKLPFTHFISVPMNDDSIISGFNDFKNDVLNNSGKTAKGVDETIFQDPHKLHITGGILTLLDDEEKKQAIEVFNACKRLIIEPILRKTGPIIVQLQGVDCMNDDFSKVNVLYAKVVEKNDALQDLLDKIVEYFTQMGLMEEMYNKRIKLHVTFMNSKFKNSRRSVNNKVRETFDATNILKAHKDTLFGSITLDTIHISDHLVRSDGEYYQATAKIDLSDCK